MEPERVLVIYNNKEEVVALPRGSVMFSQGEWNGSMVVLPLVADAIGELPSDTSPWYKRCSPLVKRCVAVTIKEFQMTFINDEEMINRVHPTREDIGLAIVAVACRHLAYMSEAANIMKASGVPRYFSYFGYAFQCAKHYVENEYNGPIEMWTYVRELDELMRHDLQMLLEDELCKRDNALVPYYETRASLQEKLWVELRATIQENHDWEWETGDDIQCIVDMLD